MPFSPKMLFCWTVFITATEMQVGHMELVDNFLKTERRFKEKHKLGMVELIYNLVTREAEAGGWPNRLGIHSKTLSPKTSKDHKIGQ